MIELLPVDPQILRRLWQVGPLLILALGTYRGGAVAATEDGARQKAGPVRVVRHRPDIPVTGIVALENDKFLLWHGDGKMQTVTAAGDRTQSFSLGIHAIMDIDADGSDFLAAGVTDEKNHSGVVRASAEGQTLTRWMDPSYVYALLIDAQGRAAMTQEGLVPLLDGGIVGKPIPWSVPKRRRPKPTPEVVLRAGETTVLCEARDLSMQYHAPGRCQRVGGAEWRFEGDFGLPFLPCGDSLVLIEGTKPWQVVAYSLTSGKPQMRIPSHVSPVLVCINPGQLLVSARKVSIYRLPSAKPIWAAKLHKIPIQNVAASENAIAYQEEDSLDVVIIPRPRQSKD